MSVSGRLYIVIIILLVVGISSNIYVWNYRYGEGIVIGYYNGTIDGFEIGYLNGTEDGFISGYNDGTKDGFELGYSEGEHDGFDIGYDEGEHDGFTSGNKTGYVHGQSDGFITGFGQGNEAGYVIGHEDGFNFGFLGGMEQGEIIGYGSGYIDGTELGYQLGEIDGYELGLVEGALNYAVGDYKGKYWFLRNPTEQEMWSFIGSDRTDEIRYSTRFFTCHHFTATVKMNSFEAGYLCYYVYVEFKNLAHACIAFNTTDSGIIFIEPQTDRIVNVEEGKVYLDRAYYAPTYDDTIVSYVLIP